MGSCESLMSNAKVFGRYWLERYRTQRDIRQQYRDGMRRSRKLDLDMRRDFAKRGAVLRVLFHGIQGSGLATIFKQFDKIYASMGDDEKEASLKVWRHCVHVTTAFYMITFLRVVQRAWQKERLAGELRKISERRRSEREQKRRQNQQQEDTDASAVLTSKDSFTTTVREGSHGVESRAGALKNGNISESQKERAATKALMDIEDDAAKWELLRCEERIGDEFGHLHDDLDCSFAPDVENEIRLLLGMSSVVDEEHARVERNFRIFERKCREKDEQIAKEQREEDEWRRGLRNRFLEEIRAKQGTIVMLSMLFRRGRYRKAFEDYKARESRTYYKARADRVRSERKRDIQRKKRRRRSRKKNRLAESIGGGIDANAYSSSDEDDDASDESGIEFDEDDNGDDDSDEDSAQSGTESSLGRISELRSTIRIMGKLPAILNEPCVADDDESAHPGPTKSSAAAPALMGDIVRKLWDSPSIRSWYARLRTCCGIPSDATSLFDAVREMCKKDWTPSTMQKFAAQRLHHTGIDVQRLRIGGYPFEMIRPLQSGVRRCSDSSSTIGKSLANVDRFLRKWMHQFDNVDAIIFVVPLSAYDEVTLDDPFTNGLERSLERFRTICDMPYFAETFKVVLFNKLDEFERKVATGKFRDDETMRFVDFEGGNSAQLALSYVRNMFLKVAGERGVFCETCSALDDSNLREALLNIRKEILKARTRRLQRKRELTLKTSTGNDSEEDSEYEGD